MVIDVEYDTVFDLSLLIGPFDADAEGLRFTEDDEGSGGRASFGGRLCCVSKSEGLRRSRNGLIASPFVFISSCWREPAKPRSEEPPKTAGSATGAEGCRDRGCSEGGMMTGADGVKIDESGRVR